MALQNPYNQLKNNNQQSSVPSLDSYSKKSTAPTPSENKVSPAIKLNTTAPSSPSPKLLNKKDQNPNLEEKASKDRLTPQDQLENIVEDTTHSNYSETAFNHAITYGKKEQNEPQIVSYTQHQSPSSETKTTYSEQNSPPKISNDSETMSLQQAKDTLTDIQYAQVTGNLGSMDLQERRKFANWAQYNPEFLSLFHRIHSITGNVDYSRTF